MIPATLFRRVSLLCITAMLCAVAPHGGARTMKPQLHAQHWLAITGKPLAATAGAMIFQKGGNAVDAACAMIAATATMWDVLSWGGETQALIYNPNNGKVIAINALGVAPSGATPEFFRKRGMRFPPETGPLAAVTPGTPGGIMTMLAEYGTMSLADVLAPAIQLAAGYPIEQQTADSIEREKKTLAQWPESKRTMLVHAGEEREAPQAGEMFRQADLANTLRNLVESEKQALAAGKDRKAAIYAAYDRFYKGDIARELVRGAGELGGLITLEDLARWKVHIEEPVHVNYKGIEVYKLTTWVQGPVMLQALNLLENFDLKAMGYNSTRYIQTLYQVMNLAFADRDFYYGDPYFPPAEPIRGLLSKEYARQRAKLVGFERNDADLRPGDPYPFQGAKNPFAESIEAMAQQNACGYRDRARRIRPAVPPRHNECRGRGRQRMGRVGDAEWRLGARGHRGAHGRGIEPADAELRAGPGGGPLQRARAGQASARHADTHPRAERRQALSRLRRAGRRYPGSESPAVLSQRGGIRHDGTGGD